MPHLTATTSQPANQKVLDALKEVAGQPMTAEQRHKQMVSFVIGTMSSDSTLTREEVEKMLDKQAM